LINGAKRGGEIMRRKKLKNPGKEVTFAGKRK